MAEDSFELARHKMVVEQLKDRGVTDQRVLEAMENVPRELFVPDDVRSVVYQDRALPIACQQTISQPLIVAMMTEALQLTGNEHVLEVGTGSGYQTAVLSELAGHVISLERHAELSASAGRVLQQLGVANVQLIVGDGSRGWPAAAPYDRIIVTAAAAECPPALWQQLAEGGSMVIPVGPSAAQMLQRIDKRDGKPLVIELTGCRFVPLVGDGDTGGQSF